MCTCSMRIACKPGSEVPEHLNLSRTPAPFLSARLTQSRVVVYLLAYHARQLGP
jgi:hypothetical protein